MPYPRASRSDCNPEPVSIGRRVIGVSPGAAYGTAKRWLPERFAEAAGALAEARGASIALFGTKGERALCEEIAQRLNGREVTNYAGETTLAQFIDLAAGCELFLTNDSGSMHIASALGVPTVAIFGATDDTTTGPTGIERARGTAAGGLQSVSTARMPDRSSLHDQGQRGSRGERSAEFAGQALITAGRSTRHACALSNRASRS